MTDNAHFATKELNRLVLDFSYSGNPIQIDTLITLLRKVPVLEQSENEVSRERLMHVLGSVIQTLTEPDWTKMPNRTLKHADIINECNRLLSKDHLW